MRSALLGCAVTLSLLFAGCSGGGSGASPSANPASGGSTAGSMSESAIATTNAVGEPMNSLANYNSSTTSVQSMARSVQSLPLGVCQAPAGGGSFEFFAPDKNGDPNSTEQEYFYDASCTQPARDIVRLWTSTGASSETVNRSVKIYAAGNATAIAMRTDADTLTNATFDQYGVPNPANGFDRVDTGNLAYSGTTTVNSDYELIVSPADNGMESFCGDAAGYNVTGIAALNETFGWQGGVFTGGTRTTNNDGSVTWTATHAGSTAKGAIGALSISVGTQNAACPITTPMFALAGGTSLGAYTIPTVATYKVGVLTNLAISNATLANGMTLNVTTNSNVSPTSNLFIAGTITNAGAQVATFDVDAFGDGTLTVASGGAQFVITDWHVIK